MLLPEHDVYITDWANARDVGSGHGRFGFDEYVEHLISFLEAMGPGAHVVAVCQPCVAGAGGGGDHGRGRQSRPAAQHDPDGRPDRYRVNPTKVNELATGKPIEWFEHNLISRVPLRYPGAMRRVYPGFLQLTAFMSMNAERHMQGADRTSTGTGQRRDRAGRRPSRTSTTNISPCST